MRFATPSAVLCALLSAAAGTATADWPQPSLDPQEIQLERRLSRFFSCPEGWHLAAGGFALKQDTWCEPDIPISMPCPAGTVFVREGYRVGCVVPSE